MLVRCEHASRTTVAHAVPYERADVSWAARQVCRDLKRRREQELAPVSFVQDAAALRCTRHSAVAHCIRRTTGKCSYMPSCTHIRETMEGSEDGVVTIHMIIFFLFGSGRAALLLSASACTGEM